MSRAEDNLKYWVALSVYPKIGPQRFKKLFAFFGDPKLIWEAKEIDLLKAGLEEHIILNFSKERKKINPEKELEKNIKERIKIVTIEDSNYPKNLKKIENPPFLLYYKGKIEFDYPALAIIGTRKISLYGKQMASEITTKISENNIITVSGMALGIDTLVHKETLKANGKTIAVLGSGIDRKSIYPKINYNLSEEIIDSGGAIISEYPAESPAMHYNFPLRNRIISGLSLGILVIESPKKGGSLITVNYAKKQNKKIFAIPGQINSKNSSGTNELIKLGEAKMTTCAADILKELKIKQTKISLNQNPNLTEDEKNILNILDTTPKHIDKLIKSSAINPQKISGLLMILEIKGLITNLGNMNYALKP